MQNVFISYASKSESVAFTISSVLEALGGKCFVYQQPDGMTAIDADTLTKIKLQVEGSSFFIQILEGSVGTVVPSANNISILQLEMQWYLTRRLEKGNRRPLPLVVSFKPTTTGHERELFDHYVQWFQEQGIDFAPCTSADVAYGVVVGWFSRMRFAPAEMAAIDGCLDLEVGSPSITTAMEMAVVQGRPLPHKYLYTSPVGAYLWQQLSRYRKTPLRDLYDTIDYRSDDSEVIRALLSHVAKTDYASPISFIALGCGDGRRESVLASALARHFPYKKVQILLVDVSKTLIAEAAKQFSIVFGQYNVDPAITFALVDFERSAAVSSLVRRWSRGNPSILVLLGHTLGNIDSAVFLQGISSAMSLGDLLAVEIAVANDGELKLACNPASVRVWQSIAPQRDPHFEFVCGPVRTLGIMPLISRFRSKKDMGEYAIHQYYGYSFTKQDMESVLPIVGGWAFGEPLLQLVRVDTFIESQLPCLYPSSLRIVAKDVRGCLAVSRCGQPARMGVIVAEKVD